MDESVAFLEFIDPEYREAAAALILSFSSRCITASAKSEALIGNQFSSRLFGAATFPANLDYPCDRAGKPMLFIGQINFAELPDCGIEKSPEGLFLLFCNASRDFSNPKDKQSFRCIWFPKFVAAEIVTSIPPELIAEPLGLRLISALSLPQNRSAYQGEVISDELVQNVVKATHMASKIQLFGHGAPTFEKQQEICSFAGNGISWSAARSADSCYSHLVESSKDWIQFLRIDSMPEFGFDIAGKALYLLIHKEDFLRQHYDKAWMIVE